MPSRLLCGRLRNSVVTVIGLFNRGEIEPPSGFCGQRLIIFWNSDGVRLDSSTGAFRYVSADDATEADSAANRPATVRVRGRDYAVDLPILICDKCLEVFNDTHLVRRRIRAMAASAIFRSLRSNLESLFEFAIVSEIVLELDAAARTRENHDSAGVCGVTALWALNLMVVLDSLGRDRADSESAQEFENRNIHLDLPPSRGSPDSVDFLQYSIGQDISNMLFLSTFWKKERPPSETGHRTTGSTGFRITFPGRGLAAHHAASNRVSPGSGIPVSHPARAHAADRLLAMPRR